MALAALTLAASFLPNTSFAAPAPIAGGSCSKAGITKIYKSKKYTCVTKNRKLVWNTGAPVKAGSKPSASGSTNFDAAALVTSAISSQMRKLPPKPDPAVTAPSVEWTVATDMDPVALSELKMQLFELAQLYPTLYQWESTEPARAFVSPHKEDMVRWVEASTCTANFRDGALSRLRSKSTGPWGGSSTCGNGVEYSFWWYSGFDSKHWAMMGSQELGARVLASAKNQSPAAKAGLRWDQMAEIPVWIREGSQDMNAVIATAYAGKKLFSPTLHRPWQEQRLNCIDVDLRNVGPDCDYYVGSTVMELLIALHGVQIHTELLLNWPVDGDVWAMFERVTGRSISDFGRDAKAWLQYQYDKKPLPRDLVERLQRVINSK